MTLLTFRREVAHGGKGETKKRISLYNAQAKLIRALTALVAATTGLVGVLLAAFSALIRWALHDANSLYRIPAEVVIAGTLWVMAISVLIIMGSMGLVVILRVLRARGRRT